MNRHFLIILLITFKFHSNFIAQSKLNSLQFKNNLTYFEGNVNKLDVLSQINYDRQDSISELSTSYRIFYGELNFKKNNLEHQAIINYDYRYKSTLSPYIGVSSFSNEFKGFKLRTNLLVGFKWLVYHSERTNFSISTAITGEQNKFADPSGNDVTRKSETNLFRFSLRPKLKMKFSKFELLHETYFQPNTVLLKDYLIQSRTDISFTIVKKVALLISYIYYYNNQPAYSSIQKRDQKLMVGIEFKI